MENSMKQGSRRTVIFTDIGDTIVDEGTEVRRQEGGIVLSAGFLPGAVTTYRQLYREGFPIVMVADGYLKSFQNTMGLAGLTDIFAAWVVSDEIGAEKPDRLMFQTAMDKLGLTGRDKGRILMIGNNLKRDIAGASRFGIHSILQAWSPRYNMMPESPEEQPTFRVERPAELIPVIHYWEEKLQNS